MRGIDFIQIPTTLLSQSDSSVGGKTGIDFAQSKNILGAFHQPRLVYMNVSTLTSLPKREFISGMGEVIKHGIIRNSAFFDYVEKNADKIKSLDTEILMGMARENCAVKADVVSNDEKENGLRAILNFGHTIGHAVESSFDFKLTHGACVGLGMCAAAFIAVKRGIFAPEKLKRIEALLCAYDFDIKADIESSDVVYDYMQHDKKKADGKLKFILPTDIGTVIQATDVSQQEIYAALDYIGGKIS
jgi:3-dehydroquinate synthase